MTSKCPSVAIALMAILAGSILGAPARAADPIRVNVTVDENDTSTRLVLTHDGNAGHVVQSSKRKITLLYTEPVRVEPPEMRFEGAILEKYKQEGPRKLVFYLGRGFERYETFKLRNPYRLILDVQGAADRRARRSRSERRLPTRIVVLDPGHGGIEQGASGPTGLLEKDVTLAIARRLKIALQNSNPAISVVLTRDDDRAVGLDERTGVANHNRADLFVSIHLNASPRADAWGAETYYLSTDATDDEARRSAALENRAFDNDGSQPAKNRASLDPVLWDLAQNGHLAESSALAEAIQTHLNRLTGTRNRGVRQAPFRVLMGATMPAILVETGFISNPDEEERFRTSDYLNQVVDAMVGALNDYLRNLDRLTAPGGFRGNP